MDVCKYPGVVRLLGERIHDREFCRALLNSMSASEIQTVSADPDLFDLPHQKIPPGKWRRWVCRSGRGAGKTFGGGRITNRVAMGGKKLLRRGEIGIIGRTYHDARFTMVEGPSGILASAPPGMAPHWEPGNGILRWPNGIIGRIFSADRMEGMRGQNWSWVWADEPAHWDDPKKTWWTVIELACRIAYARLLLTTTPIADPFLSDMESRIDTVVTRASTYDNPYLSPEIREIYRSLYEGTRIGRQELHGEILDEQEGALWSSLVIDRDRVSVMPPLLRSVIAVDPAVTDNEKSDETGIVGVGLGIDHHVYIFGDWSRKCPPGVWGSIVYRAWLNTESDLIVGEVNNGGDLIEGVITAAAPPNAPVPYKKVHATRGKVTRAEPVQALSDKRRLHLLGHFPELEREMTSWNPARPRFSPNRLDAMVWGVHEVLLSDLLGPLGAYARK